MDKQEKWRLRNRILWRLKGISFPLVTEEGILTDSEKTNLRIIMNLRDSIIGDSVENSRDLGFKAYYRDAFGKILKDDLRNKDFEVADR